MLESVLQDLRYGARALRKAPAFALVAIATLAVGIGANVAMFTVVSAVLLRPLPVREQDRVGVIDAEDIKSKAVVSGSWTKFRLMRDENHAFERVAAYVPRQFTFADRGNAQQLYGARVTSGFFETLGVQPFLGRTFFEAEDVENGAPAAIVSYGFWQRQLGADTAVIGKAIKIDAEQTTIVGVLPAAFRYNFGDREPQVYLPRVFTPGPMTAAQIQSGGGFLQYVVRLGPGVSWAAAQAELARLDDAYSRAFGNFVDAGRYHMRLTPLTEDIVGEVRPGLLVLMAAVCLVLLIACGNVAHLLMARATSRRREIAVRRALGASERRLVRQLIAESFVLSVPGCALGTLLASFAVKFALAARPHNIPRLGDAALDLRVLAFTVSLCLLTTVLFSLAPALRASRAAVSDALKGSREGGLSDRRASGAHHLLAVSESALAVTLAIAAGLVVQSLIKLQQVDPGFHPEKVLTAHIALPQQKYATPPSRERFFSDLLQGLRTSPGITDAAAISYLPMAGANYGFYFFVEGKPRTPGRDPVIAVRHVSDGYFRTMGVRLVEGRDFTDQDNAASTPVGIINQTAARRYFPNEDPIGKRLASSGDKIMREIVGVVDDVKFDGPARPAQEELYLPFHQVPWGGMTIVLRAQLPDEQVAAALRREVARLDGDQPIAEFRAMRAIVENSTTQQRFTTWLLGGFALLAIALTSIGLYGVIAFMVAQRKHEFGIRLAIGAQPGDIVRMVVRQGMTLAACGVALGVAGALAARGLLARVLFGISPTQVATYIACSAVVVVVALVATYIPARSTVHLDPLAALRHD